MTRARVSAPTLVVLAACAGLAARARSEASSDPVARGDSLYARGQLSEAREAYRAALASQPFGASWRMARAESELGEAVAAGEERSRLVAAAVEHARAAVQAAPDSAQGHVWLAVTLGRQALKEGPKKRLALSREIKAEADRAIAIDPGIGRAYHVRALWNRKLASLNALERMAANAMLGGVPRGASMDNAVRDLEKAVALEPGYVNHHLELGRTFMMLDRDADARRELEKALALPPTSGPRDAAYQAEARKLLQKLGKR